ncbi:bola protein [Lentinula raphanica]|uniref:Bola protein n=1 Tax=Lentinula raphanica TaxID=153919 RepID=A0AA38UIH1_9AGAR|nr:bola protein [Lentinula raphanica]KAJ3842475.1 bola protein [Lentinula raphanica]
MINLDDLEAAIRSALPVSHLEIEDQSNGCGESYAIVLVSEAFEGKNTLARHRFVNDLLKAQIAQMHAFSQVCYNHWSSIASIRTSKPSKVERG